MLARMFSLPDPVELTAIADRISRHAAATRARAFGLGSAVAALDWRGLAADVFRGEAHVAISALRTSAGRLDDASDALRRHATRVGVLCNDLTWLGIDSVQAAGDLLLNPGRLLNDSARLLGDGKDLLGDALGLLGI
jgi:hypothetical protein